MQIEVALTGNKGAAWPTVRLSVNDCVIFDDELVGENNFSFECDARESNNRVVIEHYNKNNDTVVDAQGNITADKHFIINYIKVDNKTFDLDFFADNNIPFEADSNEQIITSYIGLDGKFVFAFEYPLWKFWWKSAISNKINNLADLKKVDLF